VRESFELTRLEHSTASPLANEDAVLFPLQIRPTRYQRTADSHGDGEIHQACAKLHQRQCAVVICFASVSRFHTRSRVRAPAGSLLRFRRGNIVPNRRRNRYLRHYSATFASSRAPIPASPLSASRLSTPHLGNDTGLLCSADWTCQGSLGAPYTPAVLCCP